MRLVSLAVLALMLAGCGGRSKLPPVGQNIAVPAATQPIVAAENYRINPLDVIRIDVFGEPELSLTALPVDTQGRIVMPMVGVIEARGQTAEQLSEQIAGRLDKYLRNPRVAVNVTEFASQKVTVSGAVQRPGQYQAPGRVTLMEAVAIGGGVNDYAQTKEVVVFREQDGRRFAARFDLGAIQTGAAADPVLQSGDIVVVGFSNARRIFRDVLSVLPVAAGVFVALIQ